MSDQRPGSDAIREPAARRARHVRPIRLGPLENQIGYALRRAQLAVFADVIAALADFDLSPAKFSVLTLICENPGARPSDIGGALGIQKTNFVPLLDALEQRGLVIRQPSEQDRRALALYLTPNGHALLQQAMKAQAQHEVRLMARIGKTGRDQLVDLLQQLIGLPVESGGG